MTWDMIIFVLMCALFIAGTVCTVLYCYALFKYISEFGVGDECDDDWF